MTEPAAEDFPAVEPPLMVSPPDVVAQEDAFEPTIPQFVEAIDTEDISIAETAQPPKPAAQPDLTPALVAISELGRKLESLQTQFDREIRAEATREKVVDRLHAELQEYKGDMLLNILRPVFVDLIQLHDDIGKIAVTAGEITGDASSETIRSLFVGIQQGIEDILYRQGVEPYETEGTAFDARRQRAVSTVATDDASLARSVASRHRKGFAAAGGKVIRAEIVSVYTLPRV